MGTSSTVNASDGRTQVRTYTGLTTEQTQDAFEADRAEAKRQGWIAVSQRWDTSQPIPTLIIEYRHWSGPKRRARSRWPAIGAVALAVVVMLVMVSATDREQDPGESGATAEPEPPPQPASVTDPDRASAPGLEWTLPARPSGPAGRLRPAWTPRPAAAKAAPGEYKPQDERSRRVKKSAFGKRWPFKVDSGTLKCEENAATFTEPRGRVWALNGVAMHLGLPELDDTIWRDDKEIIAAFRKSFPGEKPPTVKVSVGEMIDLALGLCS